jgi:sorting and assembly machinery component 37
MLPIPQRYYVPGRIRESYKPRLEAAGLWNPPCWPERELAHDRSRFGLKKPVKSEQDTKEKMKRAFAREQVNDFSYFRCKVMY